MKQFFKAIIVFLLTFEASLVLKKYRPKIIAVTGSVGKTSTKDAIFAVLEKTHHVRKSEKSFNSEIGVPLTILGASNPWAHILGWIHVFAKGFLLIVTRKPYPALLVLEVGVDRPGDIGRMTRWLTPHVVVVTRLPDIPVHVEYFESPDAVIEEKAGLVDALADDGLLVLNADDERVMALQQRFRGECVTFGFVKSAHVRGGAYTVFYKEGEPDIPGGVEAEVSAAGNVIPIRLHGTVGKQILTPILAAFAVGAYCEVPLQGMADVFEQYSPPNGRMRVIAGVKHTAIIDDTYNSSPVALEEALRALSEMRSGGHQGRRIAALGDMLELGRFTVQEHKRIGELVARCADMLVTVGVRSRLIAEGARKAQFSDQNIISFDNAREAGKFLQNYIKKSDVILVKGSQSMRMERTVEEIMANPGHRTTLLVRQDKEWLAKA